LREHVPGEPLEPYWISRLGQRSRSRDWVLGFFTTARWGKRMCGHDNSWTAALSL